VGRRRVGGQRVQWQRGVGSVRDKTAQVQLRRCRVQGPATSAGPNLESRTLTDFICTYGIDTLKFSAGL